MALCYSRLTRPSIRRLKPGEKITEHGITAERLATGDLRYTVNVMADGQRIHRVIGLESDGVTRTQAERFIEKARTDAREDRLSLPPRRKTHLGFSTAADKYIEKLKRGEGREDPRNIPRKEMHLRLHLKPFFKKQRLDKICEFSIRRYKTARKKEGASVATVNREMTTLTHMLYEAIFWKWLGKNPERWHQPAHLLMYAAMNEMCRFYD